MRVMSSKPCKNGGYFHPFDGQHKKLERRNEPPPPPQIDAAKLMAEFSEDTDANDLACFAKSLGLTSESIQMVGCQRAVRYQSWAFPMYRGSGEVVGIRLRRDDGSKFAVTGSRQGIFMMNKPASDTAYIVEGASDLAALAMLSLFGIGRPSCCGCISTITANLSRLGVKRAVIITDSDPPGLAGANKLSEELDIPNVIYIPPTKDLREAVRLGFTSTLLESTVQSQVWAVPKSRSDSYSVTSHKGNSFLIRGINFNNDKNSVKEKSSQNA